MNYREQLIQRHIQQIQSRHSRKRSNLIRGVVLGTMVFVGSTITLYGLNYNAPKRDLQQYKPQIKADCLTDKQLNKDNKEYIIIMPECQGKYQENCPFDDFEYYKRNRRINI